MMKSYENSNRNSTDKEDKLKTINEDLKVEVNFEETTARRRT
jgi:hypothetical protein